MFVEKADRTTPATVQAHSLITNLCLASKQNIAELRECADVNQ
jgi:hypothetical protein